MSEHYTVYGSPGCGSVPVEAALELIGVPYEVIDHSALEDVPTSTALLKVNPLGQVPALRLPDGQAMTESAAILIWLADRHPLARLARVPSDPRRAAFLRWMAYVSAALYSLAWIQDDPMRLISDESQASVVLDRIGERRAECWRRMDAQIEPGRFLLGEDIGVLDLYVATVSRWLPRRKRFYWEAPKMAEAIRRVDTEPRLAKLWAERFPFSPGWEG